MNGIKYLLDEHVSPQLKQSLNIHGPDIEVLRIGDPDAPSRGTKDPEILEWCFAKGFLLITNNRSSMPVHITQRISVGEQAAGIFILNTNLTLGETIDELASVWLTSSFEDHINLIRYLPISKQLVR